MPNRVLMGSLPTAALVAAALWTPTPATADVVIACKNLTNGNVRIVGDAVLCREHEVATSWNAQGETGPAGPAGPAGPPGPPGPPGPGSEAPEQIVLTEPVTGWREIFGESFSSFEVDIFAAAVARGSGTVAIGLGGPASIGATSYRLSQVEYCIDPINGGLVAQAYVFSDRDSPMGNTLEASDNTVRNEEGCYVLPIAGGTGRTHLLSLVISEPSGTNNNGIRLAAVRTTWVAAGP